MTNDGHEPSSSMLKICRIETAQDARRCAWLGVDLLGFHILDCQSLLDGNHKLMLANKLIQADEGYAGGVLLTRCLDLRAIQTAVTQGHFSTVQIHAKAPEPFWNSIRLMADHLGFQVIGVTDPTTMSVSEMACVRDHAHLTLVDHLRGGTGTPVPKKLLRPPNKGSTLIAGGVNSSNARGLLEKYGPTGIDVQTAAEHRDHSKNYPEIIRLITAVKGSGPRIRRPEQSEVLALAIHGQPLERISNALPYSDIIHIDLGLDDSLAYDLGDIGSKFSMHLLETHLFKPTRYFSEYYSSMQKWPLNVTTSYLQVDYSDISEFGALPFRSLLDRMETHNIRGGLVINNRSEDNTIDKEMTGLLLDSRVQLISFALEPRDQTVNLDSFHHLYETVSSLRPDVTIGIDRGITLERIQQLAGTGIKKAVVGTSLAYCANPQDYAANIRHALTAKG